MRRTCGIVVAAGLVLAIAANAIVVSAVTAGGGPSSLEPGPELYAALASTGPLFRLGLWLLTIGLCTGIAIPLGLRSSAPASTALDAAGLLFVLGLAIAAVHELAQVATLTATSLDHGRIYANFSATLDGGWSLVRSTSMLLYGSVLWRAGARVLGGIGLASALGVVAVLVGAVATSTASSTKIAGDLLYIVFNVAAAVHLIRTARGTRAPAA
jgi:hypothetical protein